MARQRRMGRFHKAQRGQNRTQDLPQTCRQSTLYSDEVGKRHQLGPGKRTGQRDAEKCHAHPRKPPHHRQRRSEYRRTYPRLPTHQRPPLCRRSREARQGDGDLGRQQKRSGRLQRSHPALALLHGIRRTVRCSGRCHAQIPAERNKRIRQQHVHARHQPPGKPHRRQPCVADDFPHPHHGSLYRLR